MAINKIVYDDRTLIDLTPDTITADKLLNGYTAHDKSGSPITGTLSTQTKSATPSTTEQTITPDNGKLLSSVSISAIQTQEKTVTASRSNQTVTPDSGKYLSKVTVNKYPNASGTYTYPANSTGGTYDMGATNNLRYVNATNVYNKGKADAGGVAAVSLKTSDLQNKPITVKNSSGTTIATATFSSSGRAYVTIPSAGTYTFIVTY